MRAQTLLLGLSLGLLSLLSLSVSGATAGPVSTTNDQGDAVAWLERLSAGLAGQSYRGVFTYERGGHRESLRITRGLVDGEEYERLEYLDGEHREIIRRGDRLTCIHPGTRLIRIYQKHQALRDGVAGVSDYYHLEIDGEDRIAGREAINLNVIPRDGYRFGYRLAVDRDTGLMLRSELIDPRGRILERFQFVILEVVPLQEDWVVEARNGGVTAPGGPADTADSSADPAWSPGWLPAGFELSMPLRQPDEDVQTFSDGMAVFSVFVEPGGAGVAEGEARQGGTVAYTRGIQTTDGSAYVVTVVGEIPRATARRIAASVALHVPPEDAS